MTTWDETQPEVRLLRAAVLAGVCMVVSVLAHVAAGGHRPPIAALPAAWVLLVPAVATLTRRRLRPAPVLALLAGGQLFAHAALGVRERPAASLAAPVGTGGHEHHATVEAMAAAADLPMGAGTANVYDGASMLAAHLLAAAAVALWLVAGERVVWRLLRVTASAVRRSCDELVASLAGHLVPSAPPEVHVPGLVGTGAGTVPLQTRALGSSSRRRGPPAWGC